MPSYQLYFFAPRVHGIARLVDFEAPDDEAARRHALAQRGDHALELWIGTRRLAEIEATDLASRVLALRRARQEDPASLGEHADQRVPSAK